MEDVEKKDEEDEVLHDSWVTNAMPYAFFGKKTRHSRSCVTFCLKHLSSVSKFVDV